MTAAAIATLQQRASDLRDRLDAARRSQNAHERGDLRRAREALHEQEHIASRKRTEIDSFERELSEINAGINALRGTRPIRDTPQA